MNWITVADWCRQHSCHEHQRYGSCGCSTNGKNPCNVANDMRKICEALADLDGTELADDIAAVAGFVRRKTCGLSRSGMPCNHRGCIKAEEVVRWVQSQLPAAHMSDPRSRHQKQKPFTNPRKRICRF